MKNKQLDRPAIDTAELGQYSLHKIRLPKGFSITLFAEVPNARSLCLGERGTVFVGNRTEDKVYAVSDSNKDGAAEKVYILASNLNMPNGVAFLNGDLYVATVSQILRFRNIESNLASPPKPETIYDKFPADESHGWKFIAFGPDGLLYVPVGAPCNICEKEDSVYSSITRLNVNSPTPEIFAHGIRNSVGFAWHPQTKELWFTDNGRDNLGDDLPSDELNHAPTKGMHFGFPYCHQGDTPDPEFGTDKPCSNYTGPVQKLGAHVAALGMRFYTGQMFGAGYTNSIFIAEHGSWNRSKPTGNKVSTVSLDDNGKSVRYEDFASGWLQPDGSVLGRPVDVLVMPDGALLVSDDFSGAIYRIAKK